MPHGPVQTRLGSLTGAPDTGGRPEGQAVGAREGSPHRLQTKAPHRRC